MQRFHEYNCHGMEPFRGEKNKWECFVIILFILIFPLIFLALCVMRFIIWATNKRWLP